MTIGSPEMKGGEIAVVKKQARIVMFTSFIFFMNHSTKDIGFDLIRISTGIVMLTASLNKIVGGFEGKAFHSTPEMFGMLKPIIDAGLPWTELVIGILLIAGLWTRIVAVINAVLMLGIAFSIGYGVRFMPGLHTYLIFISAGIAFLGTPTCCTIDGMLAARKLASVQKIKV